MLVIVRLVTLARKGVLLLRQGRWYGTSRARFVFAFVV